MNHQQQQQNGQEQIRQKSKKKQPRFFSSRSETLLQALDATNLNFKTLYDIFPQKQKQKLIDEKLITFCKQLIVLQDPQLTYFNESIQTIHFEKYEQFFTHIMSKQINQGKNYVQCKHIDFKNQQMRLQNLNFAFTLFIKCPFKQLWQLTKQNQDGNSTQSLFIKKLFKNYLMFYKYQKQYIQIAGKPLNEITSQCSFIQRKRKNKQLQCTLYNLQVLVIDRLKMFYNKDCGRHAGIFRHNSFFKQGIRKSNQTNQVRQLTKKLLTNLIRHQQYAKSQKKSKNKNIVQDISSIKMLINDQGNKLQSLLMKFMINFRDLVEIRDYKKNKRRNYFDGLIAECCPLQNDKYYKAKRQVLSVMEGNFTGKTQTIFDELYKQVTPYNQVAKLIRKILQRVVPKDLFGSDNFYNILEFIPSFIEMKRFQNLKVDDMLSKIDIQQVTWLQQNDQKIKKSSFKRVKFLIAWTIRLIFNQCIVPVIKYNFYVTQKHKQGNKIFYFRKPVWILISKLAVKQFSTNNLETIKSRQVQNQRTSKYSLYPKGKLRILPKKGTFRPIITFNRKIRMQTDQPYPISKSLNQWLAQTQLVLRNLKNTLSQRVGYSIFDNRQIAIKYDKFVNKWRQNGSPKLVYFTLDIQKCYDSIDTLKLKQIIQTTKLIQNDYLLVQYYRMYRNKKALIKSSQNKYNFPYYFNFRERTNAIPFHQDPIKIEQQNIPAINIFTGKKSLITRDQIIKNLSILCKGSIVQYQKNYWLQTVGIPQGLNVSGVVCSLYFGTLQKDRIKVHDGLLMRLTDDYVYIGPQAQAKKILEQLFEMSKIYEFNFNADKIQANFDHPLIKKKSGDNIIPWIGKLINIDTMEMFPQVQTSLVKLNYAMNVNLCRKTMYGYLKNKLKSLFTNHFASYFKPYLYPVQNLKKVLRIYTKITLGKFYPFMKEIKNFKKWLIHNKKNENLFIMKIFHEVVNQFIIYACYLCPVKKTQSLNKLFDIFYYSVIDQASLFFKSVRRYQKLNSIYICLRNQSKNLRIGLKQKYGLIQNDNQAVL